MKAQTGPSRAACDKATALGVRSSQEPHGNSHSLPQSWGKAEGRRRCSRKPSKKLAALGFWVGAKCKNSGAASCNTLQAAQHCPHGLRWPWTTIHSTPIWKELGSHVCLPRETAQSPLRAWESCSVFYSTHLAGLLHKKGDGVLVALLPEHGIKIFFNTHAMQEFFSSLI